jgi:hypothetical protein
MTLRSKLIHRNAETATSKFSDTELSDFFRTDTTASTNQALSDLKQLTLLTNNETDPDPELQKIAQEIMKNFRIRPGGVFY